MRKSKLAALLFCLVLLGVTVAGCGQTGETEQGETGEKVETYRLLLGTSSIGGTYYVWGGGWASIMNESIPGVDISVEVTGGPTTNIQLIQDGQMELGFVTTWLAGEGFNGKGWAEGKKYDKFRAMFPMYSSVLHIFTLESSPIYTVYDFAGKHIAVGAPGATSDLAGRGVLRTLGIEPREISSLPTGTAVSGIKDGTIDAGFVVTGAPGPWMLDLETTHDVRLIALSEEDFEKILDEYPYWSRGVIPAGTYKNQEEDIPVIAFWNFAVASKDLPEDLVYQLVKTTFEKQADLIAVDPTAEATVPENYIYSTVPFHPGAVRYYEELGFEIPEHLLPPEMK